MASSLIGFLVVILLVVAVIYCLSQAASIFPGIPAPIRNIAAVIIFLILFFVLLNMMGYAPTLHFR